MTPSTSRDARILQWLNHNAPTPARQRGFPWKDTEHFCLCSCIYAYMTASRYMSRYLRRDLHTYMKLYIHIERHTHTHTNTHTQPYTRRARARGEGCICPSTSRDARILQWPNRNEPTRARQPGFPYKDKGRVKGRGFGCASASIDIPKPLSDQFPVRVCSCALCIFTIRLTRRVNPNLAVTKSKRIQISQPTMTSLKRQKDRVSTLETCIDSHIWMCDWYMNIWLHAYICQIYKERPIHIHTVIPTWILT